jgi:hypothetical protein
VQLTAIFFANLQFSQGIDAVVICINEAAEVAVAVSGKQAANETRSANGEARNE